MADNDAKRNTGDFVAAPLSDDQLDQVAGGAYAVVKSVERDDMVIQQNASPDVMPSGTNTVDHGFKSLSI